MVEYISVNGKERPFLICMRGIVEMYEGKKDGEQVPLMQLFDEVAYMGFKQGARFQEVELDFTQKEVSQWLDLDMKLYAFVSEKYMKAQPLIEEAQKKMMESGLIAKQDPETSPNGHDKQQTLNRSQRRATEKKAKPVGGTPRKTA